MKVLIVGLSFIVMIINCNSVKTVERKVLKLQCNWMGYACGDCYAEYKILDVLKGDSIFNGNSIIGKDLKVVFKNKLQEKKMRDSVANCAICYQYFFQGVMELKHSADELTLLVDSSNVVLLDNCCTK